VRLEFDVGSEGVAAGGASPLRRVGRQRPVPTQESDRDRKASRAAAGETPRQQLGTALSFLQRAGGVSVDDAARLADLSPSRVVSALAGQWVPSWPTVFMLVTIFGGKAEELRVLWERARGIHATRPPSVETTADRLRDALRGVYLAAGCPDPAALASGSRLSQDLLARVLSGQHLPDWPTTARLVTRLGWCAEDLRPLWEDLHGAIAARYQPFPDGGAPRAEICEPVLGTGSRPR
jgi:hypothetical protein